MAVGELIALDCIGMVLFIFVLTIWGFVWLLQRLRFLV
jgi:hypothetical protein